MATIRGELHIAAPVDVVFDTVADTRNEPGYNPDMHDVELLTPEPVGRGSRFRALMGRAGTEMLVELVEYDRPHRLGSRTTSSLMDTSGGLTFRETADGTAMAWDWQVQPHGYLRLLGPLVGVIGARVERGIWGGLKSQLEGGRPSGSR
ncbi:hypothetical protein GCM10023168_36260 [Fodinibacter luteus]|uniref:SRPBCC family protein n=1 Tax=Fodinibacter luteus TaxID=552064 RepID=A0ABP8KRL1_9MICO